MKLTLAVLVVGSGCAQIFGIDSTSGGAGDAPMTAQAVAEVERMSIGATLQTAPEDLTAGSDTLAFLVGDSSVAATQGPIGTWTAPIATGNPMVDFTLAHQRHIWAFPTRDLKIADVHLEHPNPTPADPISSLALMVTLPTAPSTAESFDLEEIGPWLATSLVPADPLSQDIMISALMPIGGSTTPATVIPSDVVLALRYDSSVAPGGLVLTGVFQAASFAETAGTNSVSGAMTAVTTDQMFGAAIDPVAQQTRFAAIRPAVGTPSFSWQVDAAPYAMRNIAAGPLLESGTVATADTAIAAVYGNPFSSLGWTAQFSYNATEVRDIMVNGLPLELAATASSLLIPDASMPTLDFPAALPQTISIDGQSLATDNVSITLDPTMPAALTVVVDRQTTQMYQAVLYEIVPGTTTAQLSQVVEILTNDPANLVIPGGVLVAGQTYTVWIGCYADGFAGAATGDLQTTSPPFDSAGSYSGVFTVSNP
jgi:hypothetical protein